MTGQRRTTPGTFRAPLARHWVRLNSPRCLVPLAANMLSSREVSRCETSLEHPTSPWMGAVLPSCRPPAVASPPCRGRRVMVDPAPRHLARRGLTVRAPPPGRRIRTYPGHLWPGRRVSTVCVPRNGRTITADLAPRRRRRVRTDPAPRHLARRGLTVRAPPLGRRIRTHPRTIAARAPGSGRPCAVAATVAAPDGPRVSPPVAGPDSSHRGPAARPCLTSLTTPTMPAHDMHSRTYTAEESKQHTPAAPTPVLTATVRLLLTLIQRAQGLDIGPSAWTCCGTCSRIGRR